MSSKIRNDLSRGAVLLKVVVAYVLFLGTKAIRFQIWGLRASATESLEKSIVATLLCGAL